MSDLNDAPRSFGAERPIWTLPKSQEREAEEGGKMALTLFHSSGTTTSGKVCGHVLSQQEGHWYFMCVNIPVSMELVVR